MPPKHTATKASSGELTVTVSYYSNISGFVTVRDVRYDLGLLRLPLPKADNVKQSPDAPTVFTFSWLDPSRTLVDHYEKRVPKWKELAKTANITRIEDITFVLRGQPNSAKNSPQSVKNRRHSNASTTSARTGLTEAVEASRGRKRRRSDSLASSIASSREASPVAPGTPRVFNIALLIEKEQSTQADSRATSILPVSLQPPPVSLDSSPGIPGLSGNHDGFREDNRMVVDERFPRSHTTLPLQPAPSIPRNVEATKDGNALTRELFDIRRQVTAMSQKEANLLQQLRTLNAPSIPEPISLRHEHDLRARLVRVQSDLEAERSKRRKAEQVVSDIRRECREPFVVPALMDAFIEISKLTTEALDTSQPSALS